MLVRMGLALRRVLKLRFHFELCTLFSSQASDVPYGTYNAALGPRAAARSSAPSKSVVYGWIRSFKEGREAIEDDRRAGRPATATSEGTVALVQNLVEGDPRITIRTIARTAGISLHSAFGMLRETLGLRKLSALWVPKALREEQLVRRVNLSRELLTKTEANVTVFFDRMVTGDETWIYQYDPESKIQSKQWLPRGSAGPVKFKAERTARKVMATIFWDLDGVILTDFLEGERTVTASYYKAVLRKLKTALARKRRRKLHLGVLFHHDNAPAHSSRTVRTVLREFRWEVIPHPPYSPDVAPSDFFLFSKLKEHLKGTLFESMDDAKRAVSAWCNTQPPGFYKEGLRRMEFLVSPNEYLFIRESSLLRCSRQTGAVQIESTGASQSSTKGFTCLGRVHGLVGCLTIPGAKSGYLLLVSGQEFVGQHPLTKNSIYKVERVSAVPWKCVDKTLHLLESNELPTCRFHQKQPSRGPAFANAHAMIEPFKHVSSRATKSFPPFIRSQSRNQILEDVLRMFNSNGSFYYCSLADLTNSVQCLVSGDGAKVSLSKRFLWNRHSANCFLENVQPSCSLEDCVTQGWLCAMINGHVSILVEGNVRIAVISRRSVYRAGTRYLKRGIDADGCCANYVETEQVVRAFDHVSSFVLVRGSVPAFWTQRGYKYRPPPLILKSKAETMAAFRKHVDDQINLYGRNLILVNLIDPNTKEKPLDDVYIDLVLDSEDERIVYVAFNFNDYCRGLRFENVSILISALQKLIVEMGFCWVDKNGDAACLQKGVFRVNCVECLDRTNLVQTAIAKCKLEEQLTRFGMLLPDENLNVRVEKAFRTAWANNGDSISRQYAGTDALKGDYTRTGERKLVGMVKDGYHSANRYYLSHLKDYRRQMSIDCLLGVTSRESTLDFKNEEREELNKWTDCKEEEMRQMVKDCERLIVSDDEVVIGSWALVNANVVSNATAKDIDNDMDTVIILTREAYYVADYDEGLDKFLHFQKVLLQSITKIEVGPMTVSVTLGFARSKATCIRISYVNDNYETFTHVWRSASTRFFNGIVITVDNNEEAEENLLAIVEQFRVALNLASLVVPITTCGQLEGKSLAKSVLAKTKAFGKEGLQAFGSKLASVNGTLRRRRSSKISKNYVRESQTNESVASNPTDDVCPDGTHNDVLVPPLTSRETTEEGVVDYEPKQYADYSSRKLSLNGSRSDQNLMTSSWNSIALQSGTFSSSCQNFITQVGKQIQQTAQKTVAGLAVKSSLPLSDRYAPYRDRVGRSPSVFILL
ncbi:hypothetical protein M513_02747 [Trichuris suis]|uniref:SAC domain-containing protein n=1 Tax=Trichuris suis TaxID=68888 RepID=A0A085MGE6_9BILA|nr:hypothetical protein M513_02747 [Trichuris suis]